MKNCCLIFLAIWFLSCQKSKLKKDITGVWELEKLTGWVTPNPYPPGSVIFTIRENGTYETKLFDSITGSGNYEIRKKKDCRPRSTDMIFWTDKPGIDYYFELDGDELTFSTSLCLVETWTVYYKRIR